MDLKIRQPYIGSYPISFKYGQAPDWYVSKVGYPHNGIDFAMPIGVPIIACDDGQVKYADNTADADGKGINIYHTWGMSQYWHLSSLSAKMWQDVKKGNVIGYSGDTGFATGAHLHFGIKIKGKVNAVMHDWIDPFPYISECVVEPSPTLPVEKKHIVMIGDTLWKIAVKYYGRGYRWVEIYEANKNKIKNPNLIYPLQILQIP